MGIGSHPAQWLVGHAERKNGASALVTSSRGENSRDPTTRSSSPWRRFCFREISRSTFDRFTPSVRCLRHVSAFVSVWHLRGLAKTLFCKSRSVPDSGRGINPWDISIMTSTSAISRSIGSVLRSLGALTESTGIALQGSRGSAARLNVHQTIQPFGNGKDMVPKIPREVFVAPNASIIGSVEIGAHSGVYYGAGTCTRWSGCTGCMPPHGQHRPRGPI